ncbi:MAG: DUF2892 domain-containing protein, partial [Bacteroidota bacterium]
MGSIDRLMRTLVALVIGALYFTDQITGLAAIVLGIVAIIFVLTSSLSFCPIYKALKISTKKNA